METAKLKKKYFSRKKIVLISIVLIIAVITTTLSIYYSHKQDGLLVQTAMAGKKPLGESVFTTGRVQLVDRHDIYAQSSKIIKKLTVKPGDMVKKGQIIGRLESSEEENRLKEAEAGLALQIANYNKDKQPLIREVEAWRAKLRQFETAYSNARKKLDRTEYLLKQNVVSIQDLENDKKEFTAAEAEYFQAMADLDKAENGATDAELEVLQAQVEKARAEVETARASLAKCLLTVDRDGMVLTVEAEKGTLVTEGTKLVAIGDPNVSEVKANLGEADSGRVKPGQKVKITAAALPEAEFDGTVTEVAGAAVINNKNNGQQIEVPIKVSINPGLNGLKPGYTVDLKIITVTERTALAVPYEAIINKDGKKQVFAVRNDHAKLCTVKTGFAGELYIEVLEGLKEGDKVILNPGENITDGSQVKVTETTADKLKEKARD
ncbi:efflux transporter, RND family, MFP subunit [Desulfofarcimen acetoxidans DSM 771]|uniref:Efflux transporter, RND family, MFP subunit n=1 Tax=Desulfofarcimen acetoxidans (strain ATCC 49208 / DSM 771 / KCTC 5769 / VKM B-1644 / 5575) TaxID=485916 RepID=C8VW79_DESAS|nr:efflux RND transporter periplasmic adaptor subunit [Desulfofarcimen acetoxidans]ACV62431.1 efflux transporter, RND family, MFP subunit [Desulfofarcimen acetoxidans DSM 771]